MKKRAIPFLFTLSAFLLVAESMDLSIDQAVTLGMENNLNLKVQDITVSQADRNNRHSWNAFLPDVGLTTTVAKTNKPSPTTGYDDWTLVGDLSAQLVLNPAIGNGIKALDLNLRTEELNREIDEKQLEQSIKKYYYQLVQLQASIALVEKNIATTEQRYRDMQAMYSNGLITELDLLQTESGLSSLTPTLTTLKNSYEQLRMALCMDLGLPLNQELNLTNGIEADNARSFDADRLVNRYLSDNLDIQSMILGKDSTKNGIKAQRNQSLPSLILSWDYSPTVPFAFEGETWKNSPLKDNDGGAFSVTLSIPLDDWLPSSGASDDVKDMEATLASLEYQEKLLYQGTEMTIRQYVMTLDATIQNLSVMENNVVLAQKAYDMSREQWRNGQMTATDLSQAENDLLQAESNLLGEKYTYISSLLDLEYAVNRDLSNE